MRAGRLDRKIDIERFTSTVSSYGDNVETWTKLASRRAAGYRSLSGAERFVASQFVAKEQVEFIIRYSSAVADVNPLDRVIYPAQVASSPPSPTDDIIYDVMSVTEIGRREGLRILAARRAENV